jgi:hypothetical protein
MKKLQHFKVKVEVICEASDLKAADRISEGTLQPFGVSPRSITK